MTQLKKKKPLQIWIVVYLNPKDKNKLCAKAFSTKGKAIAYGDYLTEGEHKVFSDFIDIGIQDLRRLYGIDLRENIDSQQDGTPFN